MSTLPDSLVPVRQPGSGAGELAAVLFDMDGTLIDTERLWFESEREVTEGLGGSWSQADQEMLVGGSARGAARYIIELTGASESEEAVMRRLADAMERRLRHDEVRLMPGAAELLAEVRAAGVPAALVTSTHRRLLTASLETLGAHHFDLTIAGDEVAANKPDPEAYLTAARRLGVDPARCVVLEDSFNGVNAGQAAGCVTVAVPSLLHIPPAPGRVVVGSLTEIDLEWLRELVRGWDGAAG
ncbi:HAD family hydrolase [Allonocardiopsis opalescens]|uniref:HAD superfamily hydrolase (TIGR01509 family) n=1 Tax=Allonocardiopsis opalescens TaxID=1144618 RepID=A0A2T0Q4D9_9ACTN|nr:HAD family phosphatase [Allonocardiopsis opalescens]PRX98571.1 HAD superfamily hydrolase (TIGR01509 family) [Allonocardiopsis opalescens]